MSGDPLAVQVGHRICLIRGEKVMLDHDLAYLYGVETAALNRAVRRNRERFPPDFRFQLTAAEWEFLRCQSGTSKRRGHRYLPNSFTEQIVATLSSVLRNPRAVQVNIAIRRTFVRLREMLLSNAELARKFKELERKYGAQFKVIFDAIRQLMTPPETPPRRIGFHP